MLRVNKKTKAIIVGSVALLILLVMLAGILTFAIYQPVKTGGEISGEALKGDRPAAYTMETRNYFILRLRNWLAGILQLDPTYLHFSNTGDFLLKGMAEAGIPTDKVLGIADFFAEQDTSDTLETVFLAFLTEQKDADGNPVTDENGNVQYVFDYNANPAGAILALIGADTPQEFFSKTLLTPDECGSFAYHALKNGLSEEDREQLEEIGLDRFVNIFSGMTRIAGNLETFLHGSSAAEARIMYELAYTVGRDLNVFVTVLGSETIERLFGVNPDAFDFDNTENAEEAQKLYALLGQGQGLTAYSVQTLNLFLNGLTPEMFEVYQRYTSRGERRDLIYSALLICRNFMDAAERAGNAPNTISMAEAALRLQKVTDYAHELGKTESDARFTLLETVAKMQAFIHAGANVQSVDDLQNEAVFCELEGQFAFFENLNGIYDIKEAEGANLLATLSVFHLLVSALQGYGA